MIAYHVDRHGLLSKGQIVELMDAESVLCAPALQYAKTYLNGKISRFGCNYLNYMFQSLPLGDLSNLFDAIIERDFELVRMQKFQKCVSRLQCAFASTSYEELLRSWPELLDDNVSIWQIEYETADLRDASLLQCYSCKTVFQLSRNTPDISNISMYWEGGQSPSPKPELLVHLPFAVIDRIG